MGKVRFSGSIEGFDGSERGPLDGSIVAHLRNQSASLGDRIAFTFLPEGESDERILSYRDLDRRAQAVANTLLEIGACGQPILLLYPEGLDFIVAFYACLYAGAIAVPTPMPDLRRANRTVPRLRGILVDSGATIVLTTESLSQQRSQIEKYAPEFRDCQWIATDSEPIEAADTEAPIDPNSLALLQYTSGSTGQPKGVMVSHANLASNAEMMRKGWNHSSSSVLVNWLPLFHDMGLVWSVVQTVYCGGRCVFMSPASFIQRPVRWLQAITRHGGTISGGPNFAYDYCVRKTTPQERSTLDLSNWKVAFSGAEPVRHGTLARFASTFSEHGFRYEAFDPGFGLAEATLMVSGGRRSSQARIIHLEPSALERDLIQPTINGEQSRTLVALGPACEGLRIEIVDPTTQQRVSDSTIGEVWIAGPSVAQGYWNRPEESGETFGAQLASGEKQSFLRTGDLGFVRDDELYIAGRLKDLIIIRGRNHYPQDIEITSESADPRLRPGCCAAFSIEVRDEERLVVVQEAGDVDSADVESILKRIRRRILEEHGVEPHDIVLIEARSIPKTSSGKIQRRLCREQFLNNELSTIAGMQEPDPGEPRDLAESELGEADVIEALLVERFAQLCGLESKDIDPEQPFDSYGLDSARAVGLAAEIEGWLDQRIAADVTGSYPTPRSLARYLSQQNTSQTLPRLRAETIPALKRQSDRVHRFPLAPAQGGLWFLNRLHPDTSAYNIPLALRLEGPLNRAALDATVMRLGERHETLRTRFATELSLKAQIVEPNSELKLEFDPMETDVSKRRELAAELARQEAAKPFDLSRGPLLRVRLIRFAEQDHLLLLTMHHIVSDATSMYILLRELLQLYSGEELESLPLQYADFAHWHEGWLEKNVEPQQEYWMNRLAGVEPLELPCDHSRTGSESLHGAACFFKVPAVLRSRLSKLAQSEGASLFMGVVAVLKTLLHRYSAQNDITLGAPVSTRRHSEVQGLIGFFVNTLPLRTDLSRDPSFRELLRRVRETCLGAYSNQDLPFDRLVAALGRPREAGRDPLIRAGIGLHPVLDTEPFEERGLSVDRLHVDGKGSMFDLNLLLFDGPSGMQGKLEYSSELFDSRTIHRLTDHFLVLLEQIVNKPELRLSQFDMLSADERERLRAQSSGLRLEVPEQTVLDAFEEQATRTPENIAVEDEQRSMTYAALNHSANELAHRLRSLGVGPESCVGVHLNRSADMVTALLGVFKAGGAYVPLDPEFPANRLAYMLEDSGASVLITDEQGPNSLTAKPLAQQPPMAPKPISGENLAYILYTSGSTGQPKGVEITHASLLNLLVSMQQEPGFSADDVLLAVTSLSFDIAGLELFLPLLTGGRVVIPTREDARDGLELGRLLSKYDITVMQGTPSVWRTLLDSGWMGKEDLRVLCGGEALPKDLAHELAEKCAEVWNLYGPTETTIWSMANRIESGCERIGIGRPIANTSIFILDPALRPVPDGVPGELHIGGVGLARGYHGRTDLTAAAFIPDPFSECPGSRLYKTGDRVRRRHDGSVEFLGRMDHQVKIRGYRVEPAEIEAALLAHPAIQETAVIATEDSTHTMTLVAYVVGNELVIDDLRKFLCEALPTYMLPSHFVEVDALPLTPNRKLDRIALAERFEPSNSGTEFAPPQGEFERKLATIWCGVLGLDRVGAQDDFFALGGHSLLATRVIARIRSVLGIEAPIRVLFEAPTLAELAHKLAELSAESSTGHLPTFPRSADLPLSYAQERVWFLETLMDGLPTYNVPCAFRLEGTFDPEAFDAALQKLVQRHESLRTSAQIKEGRLTQIIAPSIEIDCPLLDLTFLPRSKRPAEAKRRIESHIRLPFDLTRGPLLRVLVVRISAREHWVGLACHHLVSDALSMEILLRELGQLYRRVTDEKVADLDRLPIQYPDFAAWQRQSVATAESERQLDYWRERLVGVPPLELPADRPRPAVQSYRGAVHRFRIPDKLTKRLEQLARSEGATLFMTLLASFKLFLARHAGQEDITVATPLLNRPMDELEGLIGLFLNTVVLRTQLEDGISFRDLLQRVQATCIEAYEHQTLPFERLVSEVASGRDLSRNPLAQVCFTLQEAKDETLDLPGVESSVLEIDTATAKFDLTFLAKTTGDGLEGLFEYNTDLFDAETIDRWAQNLLQLLEEIASKPEAEIHELSVLTPGDYQRLIFAWNETTRPVPEGTVVSHFMEQALKTPRSIAVRCGGRSLTYEDLDCRSSALARQLRRRGVGAGDRVGLCMNRSVEMMIGVLGILKASAAYVPVDPDLPPHRLSFILEDSSSAACVTHSPHLPSLSSLSVPVVSVDDRDLLDADDTAPELPGDRDLAYVIYTSGSTGVPKGVEIEHRSLLNLMLSMLKLPGIYRDDVWVSVAPVSFDLSVPDLFGPLLVGGQLVLATSEEVRDGRRLATLLSRVRASVLPATPATWRLLLESGWQGSSSLRAICGGEALPLDLAKRLQAHTARLFNFYGPTEATVWATTQEITAETDAVRIGKPLPNTTVYVLDRHRKPVPLGTPGELYIGGVGIARGYHQRPELTQERFVRCSFSGRQEERLYRTGDQVRYRPDGSLEFLGRLDHQVKVRGYRVECSEIETHIARHDSVAEIAVVAKRDSSGENRLAAYWVATERDEDPEQQITALRSYLEERLPKHMVPSLFARLDALPLSHNGKVDRKALETIVDEDRALAVAYAEPRSQFETWLLDEWERLLEVSLPGIDANVFDLGATSLIVASIHTQIIDKLARTFPIAVMFQQPTVRLLSDWLLSKEAKPAKDRVQSTQQRKRAHLDLGTARRMRRRQGDEHAH